MVLSLVYSSALLLKQFKTKRIHLFFGTWIVRKYNLYAIIYNLNLTHCFQNLDNRFDFFLLNLFDINMYKVNLFVVLILTEYLILLKDLEFRKTKSSEILI